MDATNERPRCRGRWRRRRRHRWNRQRRGRSQSPSPSPSPPPPPQPPQRSESLPSRLIQYVENKMGLPPPYEPAHANPAPPPSYFGDNPPPPAGFVVPAAAPRTTVITSPPTSASTSSPPVKLGPGPTGTTCASCNKSIVTRVDYVPNNRTHIVSAALCVLAGCCCGCFVPYCMRSCKTANHYCPKCRAFVGSYTPS